MKRYVFIVAAIAALATVAQAASIGIHFPSNREAAGLLSDELAGLVAQTNWNSADGGVDSLANRMGTTADIVMPNPAVLTDDSGAITSAKIEWVSNGTWNTTNGMATPDAKLMNGYIDAFTNAGTGDPGVSVTVTDIPYAVYDAIVYLGSDGNGRQGQVTDGDTTFYYLTQSNDPGGDGGFDPLTDYIMATATSPDLRDVANYAVFSDLTDATLQLNIVDWSAGNNNGIHAVQIVEVPEPATLILLGAGALAMFKKRRR